METRILRTDFWEDDKIVSLNLDTRHLYLCLLTNPKIGQLRIYRLSDRQMSWYSGFNIEVLQKCKSDLQLSELAYFHDGFVCITGRAYVESDYSGGKNRIAKQKAINIIPESVLDHFNTILDTLSIPYQYSIDTTINLNNKSNKETQEKIETLGVDYKQTSDVWEENEDGSVSFKR